MIGQLEIREATVNTSVSGFKCPLKFQASSTFVSNEILKMWGKPIHLREGTAKSDPEVSIPLLRKLYGHI